MLHLQRFTPRADTEKYVSSPILKPCTLVFLVLLLVAATPAAAAGPPQSPPEKEGICLDWGVTIWGLSFHLDRQNDYNERNWGLGLNCYKRPHWRWLGAADENRLLIEFDAMVNSHDGLVIPLSAGAQYRIAPLPFGCKLMFMVALTAAYYRNPERSVSEIRYGPVPGFVANCGQLKGNVIFIARPAREPLSVIAASFTILLK